MWPENPSCSSGCLHQITVSRPKHLCYNNKEKKYERKVFSLKKISVLLLILVTLFAATAHADLIDPSRPDRPVRRPARPVRIVEKPRMTPALSLSGGTPQVELQFTMTGPCEYTFTVYDEETGDTVLEETRQTAVTGRVTDTALFPVSLAPGGNPKRFRAVADFLTKLSVDTRFGPKLTDSKGASARVVRSFIVEEKEGVPALTSTGGSL